MATIATVKSPKTKGYSWSHEQALAANAKHQFIHVGGSSNGTWLLSGAPKRWKEGEDVVFLPTPDTRIAGKRSDVITMIKIIAPTLDDNSIRSFIENI